MWVEKKNTNMGGKATRDTQGIIRFFFLSLRMYIGENMRWKILRINSLYWCSNFLSEKILFFNRHVIGEWIGEGNGTPLQYSCLENRMDGGAWKAAVHGVAGGRTWLRDFTFTFHFHALRRKWQPTPVFLPGESRDEGASCAAVYGVAQSWTEVTW